MKIKIFIISILLSPVLSFAYLQESYWNGSTRTPLSWGNPPQPVPLSIHTDGDPRTSDSSEFAELVKAMNAWNTHFGKSTNFRFKASTTSQKTLDGLDGVNNIFFEDMGPISTVAETRSTFFVSSGEIIDADIRFNIYYIFVGGNQPTNAAQINLADVATHELGHAFGLGHTPMHNATMYFMAQNNQRHPSRDDLAGLHALYPKGQSMSLSGTVIRTSDSKEMHGAHVVAIRVDEGPWQGQPQVSAITDRNGVFNIQGLENGEYTLLAAPIQNHSPFGSYFNGAHDDTDFVETIHGNVNGNANATPVIFTSSLGGIQIQVSESTAITDDYEGTGNIFDLSALSSNVLVATAHQTTDSTDYYKIALNSGDRIDISATAFQVRSALDLKIELGTENSSGQFKSLTPKATSDDHPFDNDENLDPFLFQHEITSSENYLIKVSVNKNLSGSQLPGSSSDGQLYSRLYQLVWNVRNSSNYAEIPVPSSTNCTSNDPADINSPIECTIEETEAGTGTSYNFSFSSGSGTFAPLSSTINQLFFDKISFNGSTMTVTPQPGINTTDTNANDLTRFFIKRGVGEDATYREFQFTISSKDNAPFIFSSGSTTSKTIPSGSTINLTLEGIIGDDVIDTEGVNKEGSIEQRIAGRIPQYTVIPDSSNPNITAKITPFEGSYLMKVTGPTGESSEINFDILDQNNQIVATSKSNSSAATSGGVASTPLPSTGKGFIVTLGNPISATPGGGGGGCGTVFNQPYTGNPQQFFNLFIFLIPFFYLFIWRLTCRRKRNFFAP